MKIHAVATGMALVLFFASAAAGADAPHGLGGFVLGKTIDHYADRLEMDTAVKDRDNNKISLILQHNSQDEDEKIGNSVKMTLSNQMDAEIKHYRASRSKGKPAGSQKRNPPDLDQLLPR